MAPVKKEKHFLMTELELDENDQVIACTLEGLISKRARLIDWHELQDETLWLFGWQ